MSNDFDWREYSKSPVIKISASQLRVAMGCMRQWWLGSVRKIKGIVFKQHSFGTVLHSVVERYRNADDQGRDQWGDPVNLYPENWHIPVDNFGGESDAPALTNQEQETIRTLIDMAIETGYLRRDADRIVEYPIKSTMPLEIDGVEYQVKFIGAVDYTHGHTVEDTKTSSSTRWLLTPTQLADDIQMIFCAYMLFFFGKTENVHPDKVELVHNQFIKTQENPKVRETRTTVSAKKIKSFWENKLLRAIRRMIQLRRDTEMVRTIAPPGCRKVCDAYGGCQFLPVCNRQMTEDELEKRLLKNKGLRTAYKPKEQKEDPNMAPSGKAQSAADLLKKAQKKAGKAAPSAAPKTVGGQPPAKTTKAKAKGKGLFANAPKPKANPSPDSQSTAVKTKTPADPESTKKVTGPLKAMEEVTPWYNSSCRACNHAENLPAKGLTMDGTPCPMCDIMNNYDGQPESSEWKVEYDDKLHMVVWYPHAVNKEVEPVEEPQDEETEQENAEQEAEAEAAEAAAIAEQEAADQKAETAKKEKAEREKAAAEKSGNADQTQPTPSKKPPAKRKSTKRLVLYINCMPQNITKRPVDVYDLFVQLRNQCGHELGEEWVNMDPFKRREAIEYAVLQLTEEDIAEHGNSFFASQVSTGTEDYTVFVRAFRSLMTEVVI